MADERKLGREASKQTQRQAGGETRQSAPAAPPMRLEDLPAKLATLPSLLALRGRRRQFALGILAGLSGSEAARRAGYTEAGAKHRAYHLLHADPKTKQAIEEGRRLLAESTGYDLAQAMTEADEALKLARDSGNAMAFTKTVEFRAKLHGLLVDKHEIQLELPDVTGAIGKANARLVRDVDEAVDGELVEDEPAQPHETALLDLLD